MINISVEEANTMPLVGRKVILDTYIASCLAAFRLEDIQRIELTIVGWKSNDPLNPRKVSSVLLAETGSYHAVEMLELK